MCIEFLLVALVNNNYSTENVEAGDILNHCTTCIVTMTKSNQRKQQKV